MTTTILNVLKVSLLHSLLLVPLIFAAFAKTKKVDLVSIILFFTVILTDNVCLRILPKLVVLNQNWNWNWVGKISEIVFAISFIYLFKRISFAEYGFTTNIDKSSWKPIIKTFALFSAFLIVLQYSTFGFQGFNLESHLFQATMPGPAEELIFRGVLLGLLNFSFGKQWTFFGATMGWGVVITSLLFGLVHGLTISKMGNLDFSIGSIIISSLFGFVMAWAKERNGSLIPPILGHSFIDFSNSF